MTTLCKTDILPEQDAYFLLHDARKYAIHGGSQLHSGLLVFSTLQAAMEFCRATLRFAVGLACVVLAAHRGGDHAPEHSRAHRRELRH